MADEQKIAKLEEKIRGIMTRPTYATTPAWHQEVAELRLEIEEIRSGKTPAPRPQAPLASAGLGGPAAIVTSTVAPAGGAHAGDHDDAHEEHPNYMAVFFWLTILTLIELALSPVFGMRGLVLWIGLAFFASLKALAVAFYYMHLKFERLSMKVLLLLPIALIIVLFLLIIPDAVSAFRTILE